jgi:hypothetical protein
METKTTIETLGYILKEELLTSVKNNMVQDTLVFETQNPFPGYHGKHLPGAAHKPEFIYFVTKEKYSTEHIFRTAEKVKKYFGQDINIARTELTLFNRNYNSFRIKGSMESTRLQELLSCFKSEGIKFEKYRKIEANALIRIQKTFWIEEKAEGIFYDLEEPMAYFLKSPSYINWDEFKTITLRIKNNSEYSNFDAALGLFYVRHRVVDFVRIFDKDPGLEKLKSIQEKYFNEIKRLLLDRHNIQ